MALRLVLAVLLLLAVVMRLLVRILVGLLVGWLAGASSVFGQAYPSVEQAEEPGDALSERLPVIFSLGADLLSRYVSRGVPYSKGPIVRPWLTASHLPYYAELKAIYDVELDKISEFDVTLDYSMNLRSWLVGFGYNLYILPATSVPNMHEGYLNMVALTILNPSAKLHYSQWRGVGTFIMRLGLRHTFDFERSALDCEAITIYRNDKSFIGTEFRMTVPIPVKQFTVLPTIRYSLSVKDEIADVLYGGLILRFVF